MPPTIHTEIKMAIGAFFFEEGGGNVNHLPPGREYKHSTRMATAFSYEKHVVLVTCFSFLQTGTHTARRRT